MKSYDSTLKNWLNKEKDGVSLLKTVANLMYDKGVTSSFQKPSFRNRHFRTHEFIFIC